LVRVRFIVPAAGLGLGLQVVLRAQLLGLSTGALPELEVTYRRLPRPAGAPISLVAVDVSPALAFASNVAVTANNVVEIESAPFPVAEGDTVLVTMRRRLVGGGSDGYLGEVGLLRLSGIVTNVGP
jgi:hypothetical protein